MNAQNDVNFIITALSDIIARLQGNTAPKSSLTFGEWLKEWYPLYVRPSLRETTAFTYELYLFRYIIPALGELRLHEVDERTLQRYLTGIKNGNTRKKQAFLINRALRKAVALGMLHRNPFVALELPKYHSRHYRQLEFDEQNAIFAKSASRPEYQALFFVLCCTGLRIGECLALDFNRDFDEKNGIIHVTKTIDIHTGEIYNRTKTLAGTRQVPFVPELLSPYIRTLRENADKLSYDSVRSYFRRTYSSLNVTKANQHSLRHTFISLCHVAGIPPKFVQHIVGHSNANVTMDVYTHLMRRGTSPMLSYVRALADVIKERYY